jgi:two-component sensor histidine kinase
LSRLVPCFLLLLALALLPGCRFPPRAPVAVAGVLDLRSWDFRRDGPVRLAGEWDFFGGRLIHGEPAETAPRSGGNIVPGHWSSDLNVGTYRLTILLPEVRPALGIRYTTVSTAFELDVDGRVSARAGRPSADPAEAVAAYKPGVALIGETGDRLVLVVRASNHEYRVGGMWRVFTLGDAAYLERRRWLAEEGSLCIAASLAVIALIFLFFNRTQERPGGYSTFSIFAISASLRALVTGEYAIVDCLPGISFGAVIRLEYLSFFSLFLFGLLVVRALFPGRRGLIAVKALVVGCSASFLLLLAPLRVLTWGVLPYYVLAGAVIAVAAATIVAAVVKRIEGGLPLAMAGVALVVLALNDMLFAGFLLNTANLFPYGMLVFIGAQAYVLSGRYRAVQANLRESISQKDMLIREVHHRVKNSLQIVSSIVSLRSHRSSDPSTRAAYEAIRDRIRAISLLHEKLYSLDAEKDIDAAEYARDLVVELSRSFNTASGKGIEFEADNLRLPPDFCIDLGLAMTELVANAYKHGGAGGGAPAISVRLKVEGASLILSVRDDGPGFPAGFDVAGSNAAGANTLGFKLIQTIMKKRKGSAAIVEADGAFVMLRFPLPLNTGSE